MWSSGEAEQILAEKRIKCSLQWLAQAEVCRSLELIEMSASFASQEYKAARRAFVAKKGATGFVSCQSPVPQLQPDSVVLSNNVVPAGDLLLGKAAKIDAVDRSSDVVLL